MTELTRRISGSRRSRRRRAGRYGAVAAPASTRPAPYCSSGPGAPRSRAVAFRRSSICCGGGLRAEHAGGDDQRRGGGDLRGGHRGAVVVGRVAEGALVVVERELEDRAAGGALAGRVGERRVVAAAGGDEVEARAGVGVLGEAAVLGDRADARARRAAPPGRRRGLSAVFPAAATISAPLPRAYLTAAAIFGIWPAERDRRGELEAQVDDLRALLGGVADALGDRVLVAVAARR